MSSTTRERILSIGTPIAILVVWELLAFVKLLDWRFFPPPSVWAIEFVKLTRSGELLSHISASLVRLAIGFLLGSIPGIVFGLWMGLSRTMRAMIDPLVAATYPIPKIAVFPLLILIFGIGESSKIVVVALSVLYLVLINTYAGVANLDQIYFDVAKNYGANARVMFTKVVFPGALPLIFAGLRLGLGVAFIVVVSAEFVAAKTGLGFMIWQSWEVLLVEKMYVGLIVIAALGLITTYILEGFQRLVIPWKVER
ncbi:MAG: ABC transporter permease [Chloroflexi bacterium]|nr:ABC transporter permease [Chloroflexota bacterium]